MSGASLRSVGSDGPDLPPVLLRVNDAARILNLSRTTVYELIRSGDLRTVHVGSACRIPVSAITEYVGRLEREAA
jgi:excisionase family DNA binding protein